MIVFFLRATPSTSLSTKLRTNTPRTSREQHESRDGDVVKGYYSLHERDGTVRIVHYTANKKSGFHAQVERTGHAIHEYHHHH